MGVGGQGCLEAGEASGGVMEIGNRLVEAAAGEVGKQGLEGPEGLRRGLGLGGSADDVMSRGPLDEVIATPAIAGWVDMPGPAGYGRDEAEGASMGVGHAGGPQLGMRMRADPFHVLHEQIRLLEDLMVDALQDEAPASGGGPDHRHESIVDVSAAVRGRRKDLAAEVEFGGDEQGIIGGSGHFRTRAKPGRRRTAPDGGCWPGRPVCLRGT